MTDSALAQAIKDFARQLGFQLAGFTTPEPPPHIQTYEHWLQENRHADMSYLARPDAVAKRADPRQILPECQTILVLGVPYSPPDRLPKSGQPHTGRVAAYAWGDDYHDVLPPRLRAIIEFIEQQVGHPVPNRYYTDTGPILERDLAQRAGLGWIGRNTCLISPRHGSYFLLAEILLGLALPVDEPTRTDHCGTCTRCVDACPTHCIRPDRTLDAGRCISYLTIENKGEIPEEFHHHWSDWVFGCDICQVVCPWNIRFAAHQQPDPAFSPRTGVPYPNLIEACELTPVEFNARFKNSPIRRAKRRGYIRNALAVLGNSSGKQAIKAVKAASQDEDPLIREHAYRALSQLGRSS